MHALPEKLSRTTASSAIFHLFQACLLFHTLLVVKCSVCDFASMCLRSCQPPSTAGQWIQAGSTLSYPALTAQPCSQRARLPRCANLASQHP